MTNETVAFYAALAGCCATSAIGVVAYLIHDINKRDVEHMQRQQARMAERLRIAQAESERLTEQERAIAQQASALLSAAVANERMLLLSKDDRVKQPKPQSTFASTSSALFRSPAALSNEASLLADIENGLATLNGTLDVVDRIQDRNAAQLAAELANSSTMKAGH